MGAERMIQPVGLVPLDGSSTGEAVLPWSLALARALGMRLLLVQFITELGPPADPLTQAAERAAHHYLDGVAASLHGGAVPVETKVMSVDGDIADRIAALGNELQPGWIMVGTHGRSGYRRWILGSVADGVVRKAHCPVLVVRSDLRTVKARPPELRRVIVPLDGSSRAEAVLPHASDIARSSGAVLDLVQVAPWAWMLFAAAWQEQAPAHMDAQMEQQAGEYLRSVEMRVEDGVRFASHVLRGDPAEMLLEHAHRGEPGLIAMTTHGRSGIARWALGSIADRIVHNSELPVLILRSDLDGDTPSSRDRA
jgi:nucleotide-binding universal stress UspA family protein